MTPVTVCALDKTYLSDAVALSLSVFGGTEASCRASFENGANRFFAAVCDGCFVGFGGYSVAADQADVIDVAVAPLYRRRGIARMLMEKMLTDAAAHGACDVFLEVRASNEGAIALYTSLGFTPCGVRKNYYANPREDAVLMTCPIGTLSFTMT